MGALLEEALARIPSATRSDLCDEYRKLYQLEPPFRISRKILELAVAYQLQVKALGGLNPASRRLLFDDRPVVTAPKLGAGSVLVREWQGVHHTVRVTDRGIEYRGEIFRSLSAVAKLISGHHRSGTQFFGLKAKQAATHAR